MSALQTAHTEMSQFSEQNVVLREKLESSFQRSFWSQSKFAKSSQWLISSIQNCQTSLIKNTCPAMRKCSLTFIFIFLNFFEHQKAFMAAAIWAQTWFPFSLPQIWFFPVAWEIACALSSGLVWLSAALQTGCAVPTGSEGLLSGLSQPGGQADVRTHTQKKVDQWAPATRQRNTRCSAPFT